MTMRMLIDARHREETRVAVVKGNRIEEFDFESAEHKQLKGNIYLAKVTRVEPSLQAAFIDFGGNRHGFLAFSEIHPDYYQIPREDREALLREEAEHAAEEEALRAAAEEEFHGPGSDGESNVEEIAPVAAEEDEHDGEPHAGAGAGDEKANGHKAVDALREKRMNLRRRYKIQDVIRRRQVLLVQVVKEERGNKGAALTTYLSLAGRYCVLMPNSSHGGGISRKINNSADRKRLKEIMGELKLPPTMGCIVRTAGLSRTRTEIKRDFDYLARLWDEIREKTLSSAAPALIYGDSDLVKRAIRDIYNRDIDEVIVEGAEGYAQAKQFMKLLMPSHARRVKPYADTVPLFQRSNVEDQLAAMYSPIVQLKSGGYLVINPTEALVSIDINSGRSTREHGIEATAVNTNLEAAGEIARQLRLRDMAGLVVIDFIDMENNSNVRKVEKAMKAALANDRARIQVGRISSFGLMEMSRQRLRTGVLEASTRTCPHCEGTGLVRTAASAGLSALRMLEEEAGRGRGSLLTLRASQEATIYVLNRKRGELAEIEMRYGVTIEILPTGEDEGARMSVEASGPPPEHAPLIERPMLIEDEDENDEFVEDEDEGEDEAIESDAEPREARAPREEGERGKRKRRRRGRGRRREGEGEGETQLQAEPVGASDDQGPVETEAEARPREDDEQARRGRRGRRGGRRRREGLPVGDAAETVDATSDEPVDEAVSEPELPIADTAEAAEAVADAPDAAETVETPPVEDVKPKRTRRRPKAEAEAEVAEAKPAPKPRGRRKTAAKPESEAGAASEAEAVALETRPETAPELPEPVGTSESAPVEAEVEAAPADTVPIAANDQPDGPPRRGWWQRTFGGE